MTEDEHHRLNGHECEQASGDAKGQGRLEWLQSMGSQRVRHDLTTIVPYMLSRKYVNNILLSGKEVIK